MLLPLLCGYLNAQTVNGFTVTEASWSVIIQDTVPDSTGAFPYYSRSVFLTGSDTLVENYQCVTFHQVDFSLDTLAIPGDLNKIGYLYEDSNRRVYYLNVNHCSGAINSMLLYDFSLSPGDTIVYSTDTSNVVYSNQFLVLSFIDSVFMDHAYRKQFHFFNSNDVWIEGIGSLRGLLHPIQGSVDCSCAHSLVCYKNHGSPVYLNPSFNTCLPGTGTSGKQIIEDRGIFNVYPNPVGVSGTLKWDYPAGNKYLYEVYNSSGKIVIAGMAYDGRIIISESITGQGLYFVKIISGPSVFTAKFTVQ